MPGDVRFLSCGPIGDTDVHALPVRDLDPSIGYYTQCLGFGLVSKTRTSAVLERDDVRIGLAVSPADPCQASCWFNVSDVDALRREYEARFLGPSALDEQVYDDRPFRVFFAKEPYGVCFCFTQSLEGS